MRAFSVVGVSKTGKTTTIEHAITELKRRRYSVGSIKDIHFEDFAIDTEGTNTDRHHRAGAQLVTARGLQETDVLFKRRLPVAEILRFYCHDFVVMEGVEDFHLPKIVCAHDEATLQEKLDETVFAVSGRISEKIDRFGDLPVINAVTEAGRLVDLIEETVFTPLPNLPVECCGECGFSCRQMTARILRGEAEAADCPVQTQDQVQLRIGGKPVDMVPFVQRILKNAVEGVAAELDGYVPGAEISVTIGGGGQSAE